MMRILFTILFISSLLKAYTQEQWGWQAIDTTTLVCQYEYLRPSIMVPHSKDDMRLEIGKYLSKFYSRMTFEYDSLRTTPEGRKFIAETADKILRSTHNRSEKERSLILHELPSRKCDAKIYKKYQTGNMYIQDLVENTEYEYTEDIIPQPWVIQPDTMVLLGFHCQKAMCSWRGRDYEAWFTSDIPVIDGPMKFTGLPGLIVKVSDTESQYIIELKGIEKRNTPIYLNKSLQQDCPEFIPTSRRELLELQSKIFKNRIRGLQRLDVKLGKTSDLKEDMFDLLERDYK